MVALSKASSAQEKEASQKRENPAFWRALFLLFLSFKRFAGEESAHNIPIFY
ncbi:MAG: hypothetical protein LBU32_27425 [Clostridiales bacterium]|nr:hypothetical protein [Clostridiales bacterium]